jgi:hypothetical protein
MGRCTCSCWHDGAIDTENQTRPAGKNPRKRYKYPERRSFGPRVARALLAAVVTTAVALVMAAAPARRGLTRATDSGAPPVRPAGGTPDRG